MEQPEESELFKYNCCCPAIYKLKQWAKNIKSKGKHQKKYAAKDQCSNITGNKNSKTLDNLNYLEAYCEHPQAAEGKLLPSNETLASNANISPINPNLNLKENAEKSSSFSSQDGKKHPGPRNEKLIKSVLCRRNWDILINDLTEKGKIDFYIPKMSYKETKAILTIAENEHQNNMESLTFESAQRITDIDIWDTENLLYYYFLHYKRPDIHELFPIHVQLQNSSIYELRSELGRGGFGIVFNCVFLNDRAEKEFVIKIPFSSEITNNSKRFISEAQVLESLSRLVYKDECTGVLVYTKIHGNPLYTLMKANYDDITKMTEYVEKYIAVAEKFKRATNNQFYHGDIRPGNIIVDESGEFQLIDFGSSFPVQAKNHDIIEMAEKIKMRDAWCLKLSKVKLDVLMLNPNYQNYEDDSSIPHKQNIKKIVLCRDEWDSIIKFLSIKSVIDFCIPFVSYKDIKKIQSIAENERQLYMGTLPSEYPPRTIDADIWDTENLLHYYFLHHKRPDIQKLFPIHVQMQDSSVYELRSELGRGGFGIVFNCILYDDPLEKEMLMKIPFPNSPTENVKTFVTEAQVLESLSRLVYKDECTGVLVYTKINGTPLHRLMKAHYDDFSKMTEYVEKYIAVVEKFKCDTNNQFYHGDIRPANIIVDESGEFHLIDFGSSFPVQAKNYNILEMAEKIKMRDEWCLQLSKIRLEAVMLKPDYRTTAAGILAINDCINSLKATGREAIASALQSRERM